MSEEEEEKESKWIFKILLGLDLRQQRIAPITI
jgi:hypothetical protein